MFYGFMSARYGPDCWWLDDTIGGDVVFPGAGLDRSTYPHTDIHNGLRVEQVIIASVAVRDFTEEMAPLQLISEASGQWCSPILRQGELLVRNADVIHRGSPNVSNTPRCLAAVRFILADGIRAGWRPWPIFPESWKPEFPVPLRGICDLLWITQDRTPGPVAAGGDWEPIEDNAMTID